jgi:hypothetical protein
MLIVVIAVVSLLGALLVTRPAAQEPAGAAVTRNVVG